MSETLDHLQKVPESEADIYDKVFRPANCPVGLNFDPAITGWLAIGGIDEAAWMARDIEPVDFASLRRTQFRRASE